MVIFLTLSSATTSPSVLETSPFILRCSYLTRVFEATNTILYGHTNTKD